MLKNVNELQHFEACLHFLVSEYLITQVGMHYKSNQVAYIIRKAIASNRCFEQKISKIDHTALIPQKCTYCLLYEYCNC